MCEKRSPPNGWDPWRVSVPAVFCHGQLQVALRSFTGRIMNFKQQYKNPRSGFGDTNHGRLMRACNYDKTRKEVRSRAFNENRNLQDVSSTPQPDVSTITDERMKKLIKWKEERERKKKLEASKKKPAFKVGAVHHSLYCSPINELKVKKTPNKNTEKQKSNSIQKRVSRVTEKRLLAKAAAIAKQPIKNLPSVPKKPSPKMSFAPIDHCFKPPPGLEVTSLFGLTPMKRKSEEKCISSQKNTQTFDNTTKNFKTSTNPRLSANKQNSTEKLNKPSICTLNKSNIITSSLKEQAKNQIDMQEQNSSLSSNDIKTPPLQKITPTCYEKENCAMEDLIIFSPYLTRSRGKRNSRKEGQQRLGIGRRSEEIPTKDTVMQNLNICVEEEERTAQYFKFLVNKETDRLKELCKQWLDIRSEKDVPEDAVYEIQQAVGQTNLLINKKFERFRGLVQDCETGKGEMLVTCRDLQGFWDLTYQEVENCNMRFERLEKRRNRKWEEEEEYTAKPVKKSMPVNKQKPKKQVVSSKPSKLQSFILAARKKSKIETNTLNKEDLLLQDVNISEKPNKRKSLTVENKEDTKRSARPGSIQKVQLSDKFKRMRSPFAAMKISQKCKTPEIQLDDTISYVNSDQTPGKSILKKSEELENKEARIKSAHKVNFDDTVFLSEVPLDEEVQNKLSLAAALNRIDSLDLDEMNQSPYLNVGKKLDFENSDSSDDLSELEFEKIEKRNKSIQNTSGVHSFLDTTFSVSVKKSPNNGEISTTKNLRNRHKDTPNKKRDILFSSPSQAVRDDKMTFTDKKIILNNTDLDLGTKVLRNRTVLANNTPKSDRISKMMTPKRASINKERKSSLKSSRKSSLKLSQKDENKYMTPNKSNIIEEENVTLMDNIVKRRLLRKSVAFDETCVACAENKPVLPMTPYSKRRSKTASRQSQSKHALEDEDLISWNTPNKNHSFRRVTRSHPDNV
ncbi:disks large-associated protein 5 isoform X1 [Monomorium pharaonis]|uniref:disks large-associated protein 5 isoform X1 n=1 Tax=Monomorium pharaonis TaxID=307658 RepID=UPI001746AF74|nr:disks large-associated protein 5 isoform X1 [Monomorium pharaonis]XP_036149960.1 disks large-associated protein 5 isoform X1 [Monomorium pharaonis]